MAKGTYENGQRDATIQSVADDVAEIKEMLKELPCALHGELLSAHKATLRIQWGILALLLVAVIGGAIKLLT